MRRQVVITGIGVVSPVGADRESTWHAIQAGRRAVRRVSFAAPNGEFVGLGAPALSSSVRVAETVLADGSSTPATLRNVDLPARPDRKSDALASDAPLGWAGDAGERPDRLGQFADRAATEAMADAGLATTADGREPDPRFGCAIGSSKGNLEFLTAAVEQFSWTELVDPRLWFGFQPHSPATELAAKFGLGGPSTCPVAACATGLLSVIRAAEWIADDRCDAVLAGSADASLLTLLVGSYGRMGVLAPADTTDPPAAVRPFSRDRNGFAIGEGAAMFVIESAETARRRGARAYAEIAGSSYGCDAESMTALSTKPDVLDHCIRQTLRNGGLEAGDVGHINCHATATRTNDPWETSGIKAALGARAHDALLTANKSMIGHLLGAAGSVELAMAALALRDQCVPPTMNLFDPDPECDLNYTPGVATRHHFAAALKLSLGFGGHVAVLALREPPI